MCIIDILEQTYCKETKINVKRNIQVVEERIDTNQRICVGGSRV